MTRMIRWFFACLTTVAVASAPAYAEDPPRIAIVSARPGDRLSMRLRDELAALGLEVVPVASSDPTKKLDTLARNAQAAAAVRIVSSSSGVEVWIADRVTGKIVFREVVSPESGTQPSNGAVSDDLVALRTVELLRASLLEVHTEHPSRGEVEPPAPIRALAKLPSQPINIAASRSLRMGLDVGASWLLSPGGAAPAWDVRVGAFFAPWKTLAFDGQVWIPASHPAVERSQGSAKLSFTLASIGVRWAPAGMDGRFSWMVGAGAGLVQIGADGTGTGGYQGKYDSVTAAWPHAKGALSARLGGGAHVGIEGAAGWALPRPIIRIAGEEAAHVGWPLVALTAYASLQWP